MAEITSAQGCLLLHRFLCSLLPFPQGAEDVLLGDSIRCHRQMPAVIAFLDDPLALGPREVDALPRMDGVVGHACEMIPLSVGVDEMNGEIPHDHGVPHVSDHLMLCRMDSDGTRRNEEMMNLSVDLDRTLVVLFSVGTLRPNDDLIMTVTGIDAEDMNGIRFHVFE